METHAGEPVELQRKDGEVVPLAVSTSPASEAQKERRERERDDRQSADARNVSTQTVRAEANGIKRRAQQHLDKIAKLAPDYLPRIAAISL